MPSEKNARIIVTAVGGPEVLKYVDEANCPNQGRIKSA